MSDLADEAVAASLQFEAIKDGCKQRQSGDWVVSLKIASNDMPQEMLSAGMGQRYVCVVVPISDNEEPIKRNPMTYRNSNRAALLCTEARFKAFLAEEYNLVRNASDEEAADMVRKICGVKSRREFDVEGMNKNNWMELKGKYEMWLMLD
jgi:hypothetical protein